MIPGIQLYTGKENTQMMLWLNFYEKSSLKAYMVDKAVEKAPIKGLKVL